MTENEKGKKLNERKKKSENIFLLLNDRKFIELPFNQFNYENKSYSVFSFHKFITAYFKGN